MKTLHSVLLTAIQPQMTLLDSGEGPTGDISQQCDTLRVWCKILAFYRWLQLDQPIPLFGTSLTTKFLSSAASSLAQTNLQEASSSLIALLLEENCLRNQQTVYHEILTAAYVGISRLLTAEGTAQPTTALHIIELASSGLDKIDSILSRGCKLFTITQFSCMLALCSEFISREATSADVTAVVHLTAVLLHDAPPGNQSIARNIATLTPSSRYAETYAGHNNTIPTLVYEHTYLLLWPAFAAS